MIHRARRVDVPVGGEVGVISGLRVIEMNPYRGRRTGKVSRHKRTEDVVDPAPAIPGSVPDGLEILHLSIRPDGGTFDLDDPGERRIGYWSNEDAARALGQSTRDCSKHKQDGTEYIRQTSSQTHRQPPTRRGP